MNQETRQNKIGWTAKELARIALFVGLAIGAQYALSAVPGVELVTLLFAVFSFVYGCARGAVSAVAFALLRQLLFGFFPTVMLLYLLYYPLLAISFGLLAKWVQTWKKGAKKEVLTVVLAALLACACTAMFTLLDDLLTPWLLAYSARAAQLYFKASLVTMTTQIICVSISVSLLFYPLTRALQSLAKTA